MIQESEQLLQNEDGIAAFPLMHYKANGVLNEHPDLTSMLPVQMRQENELHPSQVLDINKDFNYYTYGWMKNPESATASNYITFGSLLLIIAVVLYFITATKLVKFIQFFLTQKQYTKLAIKVRLDSQEKVQDENQGVINTHQTPRVNNVCETNQENTDKTTKLLNDEQAGGRRHLGLCKNLSFHAVELIQFYTPLFAVWKILTCSKTLSLPKYVIISQILMRTVILISLTVAACFVYLNNALDEKEKQCIFSQNMKNTSYHCLNELSQENKLNVTSHQSFLYSMGAICALFGALIMFQVSQSIFSNFTKYLDQLFDKEVDTDTQMSAIFRQINIPSSDTVKQNSPQKKKSRKSPCKRKYDSVSSFRGLLDRDSDSSMIHLQVDSAGYDSGVQASMSTQTNNQLNASERTQSFQNFSATASNLLNLSTQQSSQRGVSTVNILQGSEVNGGGSKPRGYPTTGANAAADLLPIDEDVDDEKCSPIKPKKRTQEDSPFKRNLLLAGPALNASQNNQDNRLLISDDMIEEKDQCCSGEIAVGGFDLSIAQRQVTSQQNVQNAVDSQSLSFNLNSVATPLLREKCMSSPIDKEDSKEKGVGSLQDQEMSDSRAQSHGGFQLQVQMIDPDDQEEGTEEYDHFEGLKTLNSGVTHVQGDSNKEAEVNRNHPSINLNSFSGVDDTTLQLDTIAPIKPICPSSTKNGGMNQEQQNDQHLSYFTKHGENQPLSVRNSRNNRPGTGQLNLGIMTPFSRLLDNQTGVSNDVQTEDKNSIGAPYVRNTDVLSLDQLSKISNAMRPDSGRHIKPRKPIANQLPADFKIQSPAPCDSQEKISQQTSPFYSKVKICITMVIVMALIFSICMDAYLLHSLPREAINFILVGLTAAFISDFVLQILIIIALSSRQLCYELKSRKLPLDTVKLRLMTTQARNMAVRVFSQYREESALLKVSYQDELDIMLDKLERDLEKQSESNSIGSKENGSQKVGPRDILVKDSILNLSVDGFIVEIRQKLKFRPPQTLPRHSQSKINIIQPDAFPLNNKSLSLSLKDQPVAQVVSIHRTASDQKQHVEDSENSQNQQRRKRKVDISTFERTQQFFAEQQPKSRKRLQKNSKQSSPLKKSANMLRQSIDNIELEKFENDFPSRPQSRGSILQPKDKSQTPDKLQQISKSSLIGFPQKLKVSQFDTPKATLSQVKLKHGTANAEEACTASLAGNNASIRSDKKSEVRRKLILKRSSHQSAEQKSREDNLAGKLSAVKNYLEDVVGETQDLAGLILNDSSKSMIGRGIEGVIKDPKESTYQRSSLEFHDNFGERFQSQDKGIVDEQHYTSHDNRDIKDINDRGSLEYGQEKYSPIFSSVNRKGNSKVDAINLQNKNEPLLVQNPPVNQFGAGMNICQLKGQHIPSQMSRTGYDQQQPPRTADLAQESVQQNSSQSNIVKAIIMSHHKALSKQQSFNSPTSIHDKLQLTNEKIKNSIEGSSIHKGRRNMIMLDEAEVSKQSLNFGSANIGTALLNSAQGIPFLHQNSMDGTSGSGKTPPVRGFDAHSHLVASVNHSREILSQPQTAINRVLMQDQGQPDFLEEGQNTPEDQKEENDDDLFMYNAAETAQEVEQATKMQDGYQITSEVNKIEKEGDLLQVHRLESESDKSSIYNSQAKRFSVHSFQAQSAKTGNDAPETVYKNNKQKIEVPTEKTPPAATETKQSSTTSAFQRLVMASKRMMHKKSSEKKDRGAGLRNNKIISQFEGEIRSQSQCKDTINIMKEQSQFVDNKSIFTQPFRVGSRKQEKRSTSEPQKVEVKKPPNTATGTAKSKVKPTKHTIAGLQVLAQQSLESTFNLPDEKCDRISEILEQESMEIDTPLQPQRIQDMFKKNELLLEQKQQSSGSFVVPANFNKEQVNPVQSYNNAQLDTLVTPITEGGKNKMILPKSKQYITRNSGSSRGQQSSRASSGQNKSQQPQQQSNRGSSQKQIQKNKRGLKQRKNSQLTTKDDKEMRAPRRNSKNSNNVPKASGTHEKRKLVTQSSRENTVSSMSIDFDKMDKQRDEDYSDYSKMISAGSTISRLEDQRRRLESFLSLAQQAKSKRDIHKIQDMIRQIDETNKPLPMSRINELKLLELMASPYNQSLIAMIKVELDISRKMKEFKKNQNQQSNQRLTKSKFALPKHLVGQSSQCFVEEVLQTDDSKKTFEQQYEITRPQQPQIMTGKGGISDNRLTTVVNVRPKGIQSCRSNNDVAPKKFNRSPSHQSQSPLSVGVCQAIITGKRQPVDKKENSAKDGMSGRYSYLRSVGNAVVQTDVRNSVDRIRMNSNNNIDGISEAQLKDKSDLLVDSLKQSRFEAEGRRGTAPNFGEGEQGRQHQNLDFCKPDFTQPVSSDSKHMDIEGGHQSQSDFSAQNMQADVQKRSTTSYGIQEIGPMMKGREGFVKRIAPLQSKSALSQNKENQTQPKAKNHNQ